MPDRDGWSAAKMLADVVPNGLQVVNAEVKDDTVTVTCKLRDGWTWSDIEPKALT